MRKGWTSTMKGTRGKLALTALGALAVLATTAYAVDAQRGNQDLFSIELPRSGGHVTAGAVTRLTLLIDRDRPSGFRQAANGAPPARRAFARAVTLSVRRLPRDATAFFAPNRTRGSISQLTVRTSASTPAGTYHLLLQGRSGPRHAKASFTLVVSRLPNPSATPGATRPSDPSAPPVAPLSGGGPVAPLSGGRPFTITGIVNGGLAPGLSAPVNLAMTNPNAFDLPVTSLTVSVSSVSAPYANADHPCTVSDFAAVQFSGGYGFTVPAASTTGLSSLGLPPSQWPRVEMINRPVNQDGCKGASVSLSYSATGTAGSS